MPRWRVPTPTGRLKKRPHRIGMYYLDADAAGDEPRCHEIWEEYGKYVRDKSLPTEGVYYGSWNHGLLAVATTLVHSLKTGKRGVVRERQRMLIDYCNGQLSGDLGWWGRECFSEIYSMVLPTYSYLHQWAVANDRRRLAKALGNLARANALMLRLFAFSVLHPGSGKRRKIFVASPKMRTEVGRSAGDSLAYFLHQTAAPGRGRPPVPRDAHYASWRMAWASAHAYLGEEERKRRFLVRRRQGRWIGGTSWVRGVVDALNESQVRPQARMTLCLTTDGAYSYIRRNLHQSTAPVMGCSLIWDAEEKLTIHDLILHDPKYRGEKGLSLGHVTAGTGTDAEGRPVLFGAVRGARPPQGVVVPPRLEIPRPAGDVLFEVTFTKDRIVLEEG